MVNSMESMVDRGWMRAARDAESELPGQPGVGVLNLGDIFGKAFGGRTKRVRMRVDEAHEPLLREESDKLVDQEALVKEALTLTAEDGIVFLDEIDKIASRSNGQGRRCQPRRRAARDSLPLIRAPSSSPPSMAGEDGSLSSRPAPSTSPSPRTCCRSCRAACRSGSNSRRLRAMISGVFSPSRKRAWSSNMKR
ncbi:MAG: AAA family ATPase [Hyphomonadaceae bacterium]